MTDGRPSLGTIHARFQLVAARTAQEGHDRYRRSALCRILVIKDANYPWLLLVPRRDKTVEIIDLAEVEQAQLMTEISRVARALKEVTKCDKLNIAALGNLVPQLHIHVIARRSGDAAW